MIIPISELPDGGSTQGFLNFKCEECGAIFRFVDEISNNDSVTTDEQKFDIRKWGTMRIKLRCPQCNEMDYLKLNISK